jgi:opacity protein-like surface antigen
MYLAIKPLLIEIVFLLMVSPVFAGDDDLCMSTASGLAGSPTIDGEIQNDFGWNGAARINIAANMGATTDTSLVTGFNGNALYLGYTVNTPQVSPNDVVVIGFSTAPAGSLVSTDWRIHVFLPSNIPATTPPGGVPAEVVTYWHPPTGSGDWNAMDAVSNPTNNGDWLFDQTRWARNGSSWTLEMKINIEHAVTGTIDDAVLIPSSGVFRFYTNVLHIAALNVMYQDPFPRNSPFVLPLTTDIDRATPPTNLWAAASVDFRPAKCTGVSLSMTNIGVLKGSNIDYQPERFNPIAETNVAQCATSAGVGVGPLNTFIARPTGPGSNVSAEFRMAEAFGVMGPFDFKGLGFPDVGTNVTPPSGDTPAFNLPHDFTEVKWALSYKQSCYRVFRDHACLQVTLRSNDLNTRFLNQSVQRNLIFKSMSKARETAYVSGNFGPLPAGQKHEFVIAVDTDQRPYTAAEPVPNTEGHMFKEQRSGFRSDELNALTEGMTGVAQYAWIARAGLISDQKIIVRGKTYRLAEHVSDFGIIGSHAGEVHAWKSKFTGANLHPQPQQGIYTIAVEPGHMEEVNIELEAVEGESHESRWRAFIAAGPNFPDGSLNGRFSINAGIERLFDDHWSLEGILGYHAFDGRFEERPFDVDAWQLSANAKYFFGTGPLRPFLNGGVGVYRIDPPDDTSFGTNIGAGLYYRLNAKWGIEGAYNLHNTDPLDWSTLQLGVRWFF